MRTLLAAVLTLPTLAIVTTSPAVATPPACTVVGTTFAERIYGTDGDDVICALGGNDRIYPGKGRDRVYAGPGADRVYGSGGNDLVYGGSGPDRIEVGTGRDLVRGGPGDDTIVGGRLSDRLFGGDGDDDIDSGDGSDLVDGGAGTDYCTVSDVDTVSGCVPDLAGPAAGGLTLSTQTVDVSYVGRTLDVGFHLSDDTGVIDVRVELREGEEVVEAETEYTERDGSDVDGTWRWVLRFDAQVPVPGTAVVHVVATDRRGRVTDQAFPMQPVEIVNDDPDVEPPRAVLLLPRPATRVDAGSSTTTVRVRIRATDDASGVDDVSLCLHYRRGDHWRQYSCHYRIDSPDGGVYDTGFRLRANAPTGPWLVTAVVADWSGREIEYRGPGAGPCDSFYTAGCAAFPGGRGRFTVVR